MTRCLPHTTRHTRRGSIYVLVLGMSMLITMMSLASLTVSRIERRTQAVVVDAPQARFNAMAAIDEALYEVSQDPGAWRAALATISKAGKFSVKGVYDLSVVDPIDGDLMNNPNDPVLVTGIGYYGNARALIEVNLDANGAPVTGTWRWAVD